MSLQGTSSLFTGPRLKIERAKHHINDLQSRVHEFETGNVHDVIIKPNADRGHDVLETRIVQAVPTEFALVIGDALHNLKAALDLVVNEVVITRLGSSDDYTRFPVREDRKKLEAAVNGSQVAQASKAVASFIVDRVKPYYAGNDTIWALHRLNILDKHRLLLPVMQINGVNDIRIKHEGGEYLMGAWIITRTRAVRHTLYDLQNCQVADKGNLSLLILFDQRAVPLAGAPIIPTLVGFVRHVSGIVDGIEKVFISE
jgi:hypothetical protein